MSKTTAVNAIPYPEDSDMPDGPSQMKAMADLLDTLKWGSRNLKLTAGVKQASEDLTLTTSNQDIALSGGNLELTPAVASTLLMVVTFDLRLETAGDAGTEGEKVGEALGTVRLASSDQTPVARLGVTNAISGPTDRIVGANVTQVYALSLAAEAHTIKLRAKRTGGKSAKVEADNTRALYLLIAS